MTRFRNPIDSIMQRVCYRACNGSPERLIRKAKYDENGSVSLEVVGKDNLYLEIQSWKDACDVNLLVKRFAEGDAAALQRRQAMYMDCTNFPHTYAEMLQVMDNANTFWNTLSAEQKMKFDNDINKFFAGMDNLPDFFDKLGINQQSDVDNVNKSTEGDGTNE